MRLRLDMTVGQLIEQLTANDNADRTVAGWVNIRRDDFPWRQMVADAEQGRAEVSRVGRKLMAREGEIDRWLNTQRIPPSGVKKNTGENVPANPDAVAVELSLRRAGLRR